jgi:peptide/nickel transport system permease protein
LSSDLNYLSQAPWAPLIPAVLIAVSVGALNALADAFRDRGGAGSLVVADAAGAGLPVQPQPQPQPQPQAPAERFDADRQSQSIA